MTVETFETPDLISTFDLSMIVCAFRNYAWPNDARETSTQTWTRKELHADAFAWRENLDYEKRFRPQTLDDILLSSEYLNHLGLSLEFEKQDQGVRINVTSFERRFGRGSAEAILAKLTLSGNVSMRELRVERDKDRLAEATMHQKCVGWVAGPIAVIAAVVAPLVEIEVSLAIFVFGILAGVIHALVSSHSQKQDTFAL